MQYESVDKCHSLSIYITKEYIPTLCSSLALGCSDAKDSNLLGIGDDPWMIWNIF